MNLRFVEAFVWVARLRSITRAAEKLCLTQSAVSNRIAALEEELGMPLVDRRDRVFRLTHAGTRFLDYAERFLALQSDVKREFGAPEHLPLSLRVGGIEAVLHTWLIGLVEHLRSQNPHVEFELTVEMTPVLNELVRRGGLDLAFSGVPAEGPGLRCVALTPMPMVLVGPAALAGGPVLSVERLLDYDLLTFQRGSHPHISLMEALRTAGLAGKRVHAVSSISALVKLVESGFGLATVPLPVAEQFVAERRVAVVDSELALAPLPVFASYWDSPAAPALETAIAEALAFAQARSG